MSLISEVSPGRFFKNFSEEVHSFLTGLAFWSFWASSDLMDLMPFSHFSGVSKVVDRPLFRNTFPSVMLAPWTNGPWILNWWKRQLRNEHKTFSKNSKWSQQSALTFMSDLNIIFNAVTPGQCIDKPVHGRHGSIFGKTTQHKIEPCLRIARFSMHSTPYGASTFFEGLNKKFNAKS